MSDDKDSAQLSEYCSSVCEALKTAIREKNVDGLNESARVALEDLERCLDYSCSVRPLTEQLQGYR